MHKPGKISTREYREYINEELSFICFREVLLLAGRFAICLKYPLLHQRVQRAASALG
jgi:hypothetical protein